MSPEQRANLSAKAKQRHTENPDRLPAMGRAFGETARGKKRPEVTGPNGGQWRGGRTLNSYGYVLVYVGRDHAMANHQGYALEHRLVMANHLGRPLLAKEQVHHRDADKSNNAFDNLTLFASASEHRLHHLAATKENA